MSLAPLNTRKRRLAPHLAQLRHEAEDIGGSCDLIASEIAHALLAIMASAATSSPSSSPRLPSPPPIAEDQTHEDNPQAGKSQMNASASRRIRPGTKAAEITEPPLVELSKIDSPFALAEHLKVSRILCIIHKSNVLSKGFIVPPLLLHPPLRLES